MATIKNPSHRAITLPTRHIIPALGTLDTTNEVLRSPDNEGTLAGLSRSGAIVITFDPDPEPEPIPVAAPVAAQIAPEEPALADAEPAKKK